jgi:hypothetical protein
MALFLLVATSVARADQWKRASLLTSMAEAPSTRSQVKTNEDGREYWAGTVIKIDDTGITVAMENKLEERHAALFETAISGIAITVSESKNMMERLGLACEKMDDCLAYEQGKTAEELKDKAWARLRRRCMLILLRHSETKARDWKPFCFPFANGANDFG